MLPTVYFSLETSTPRAERGEARVAAEAGSQMLKYFSLLLKGVISPRAEPELEAAGFGAPQSLKPFCSCQQQQRADV